MTTTVVVKARGLGATVETNGETIELGPHQDHQFHITEGSQTFTVTQHEQPVEEKPAEDQSSLTKATNESGADETAQRSARGGRSSAATTGSDSEQQTA